MRRAEASQWIVAGLFAIYLLSYITVLLTADPLSDKYNECASVLCAYLTGIAAAAISASWRQLALAICILALAQCIYALAYLHDVSHQLISGATHRACGTFHNPDGLYTLTLVCLPLALVFLLKSLNNYERIFFSICCVVVLTGLLLTLYRGPTIAAAISIIWLLVRATPLTKVQKPELIASAVAAMLVVSYVVYIRTNGVINEASAYRSDSGRMGAWREGIHILEKNWLLGAGVGIINIDVATSTPGTTTTFSRTEEPKNVVLLLLDQLGVVGGVLFAFIVVTIIGILKSFQDTFVLGLGAAWMSLLLAGMFDSPFGIEPRACGNALVGCLIASAVLLTEPVIHQRTIPRANQSQSRSVPGPL